MLALLALAAGGVYWFCRGFRRFERRRLLLNTPRSKIRSASKGRVEVSGHAAGPAVITSPLREIECFYFRSLAWELREQGKKREWVKIADERLHIPFWIDDGTGRFLVDPRGAEIHLDCDWNEEVGDPLPAGEPGLPESARQFLSRHGADFSRRLRVAEYSIQPNTFLFVLGTLAENPAASSGSLAPAAGPVWAPPAAVAPGSGEDGAARPVAHSPGSNDFEIVRLSPEMAPQSAAEMTEQQRVASALIKAGINNPAVWEPTGTTPQNPLEARPYSAPVSELVRDAADRKADAGAGDFDPRPPLVMMKGTEDSPFLISPRSPRDLARSRGWKPALLVWKSPILTRNARQASSFGAEKDGAEDRGGEK